MHERVYLVIEILSVLVISYFIVLNGIYLLQGFFAYTLLKRHTRRLRAVDFNMVDCRECLPPVTVLVPSYNEEMTIRDTIKYLRELDYPDFEVILINDGSQDGTLDVIRQELGIEPALHVNPAKLRTQPVHEVYRSSVDPRIWVVNKENGGKADALNAGINYCRTPFFCAMDADTLLEPDALTRIIYPFLEERHTVAVGGIIRILNGCTLQNNRVVSVKLPSNLWAQMQILEYLRAFLSGRMSWNLLGGSLIVSGAFGMFRHATVMEAGGYDVNTVGEDMELVTRLHRICLENDKPYLIRFIPDPVAWTQCPERLVDLYHQRERWQRGLVQSLWKHKRMLGNPRYGDVGLVTFPYFFFLEMLGPPIELMGYLLFFVLLLMGQVFWGYALALGLAAFGLGMIVSLMSLALSELNIRRFHHRSDLWKLIGCAFLENIFFRQFLNLCRSYALVTAMQGSKAWGRIKRQRFQENTSSWPMDRHMEGLKKV
ncbi:MAG: glycosyl transferase [Candidatus Melainabacteria bacterium HGW-Melainabacteria-1]|nr:MAG: glycosyl transferase [Candidatus Melainabacteria bacterium HGW-Melainabacteria-1]